MRLQDTRADGAESLWLFLAVTVLTWLAGLLTALYVQDREHRRQQLGLVGLIRGELRRIRMELALDDPELLEMVDPRTTVAIPQVHPWIQGVLPQISSTSPVVMEHFMSLERLLGNLLPQVQEREVAQEGHSGSLRSREARERQPEKMDPLLLKELQIMDRQVDERLQKAEARVETIRRQIGTTLEVISGCLDQAERKLSRWWRSLSLD